MPEITKRATFYAGRGSKVKTFHVETDGCIVNITVGLTDSDGRQVTRVDVAPDDESRGGDERGRIWRQEPGDSRIICVRDPARECEDCGCTPAS
jgi:hypothetical protein